MDTEKNTNVVVVAGAEGDGPFIRYDLSIRGGLIESVSYKTYHCVWANGIGMVTCGLIEKRSMVTCAGITENDIKAQLEGIPRSKCELVESTVLAMKRVEHEYRRIRAEPH